MSANYNYVPHKERNSPNTIVQARRGAATTLPARQASARRSTGRGFEVATIAVGLAVLAALAYAFLSGQIALS